MQCRWCRQPIPTQSAQGRSRRTDSAFCGKTCRQRAYRFRQRCDAVAAAARPMRLAYADPPYPGMARRYYQHEPTYAGEVDHAALVARLLADFPDGWALSTSSKALREVLPLCPPWPRTRLCPWVKPNSLNTAAEGLANCWEALIVVDGRQRPPGRRDWLLAATARGGGELPGRKPLAFCAFLFDALGMVPGDELVDLYPGTGIVGDAWRERSRTAGADALPGSSSDTSVEALDDASPLQHFDRSSDATA